MSGERFLASLYIEQVNLHVVIPDCLQDFIVKVC